LPSSSFTIFTASWGSPGSLRTNAWFGGVSIAQIRMHPIRASVATVSFKLVRARISIGSDGERALWSPDFIRMIRSISWGIGFIDFLSLYILKSVKSVR
jgi:hypothetical protein